MIKIDGIRLTPGFFMTIPPAGAKVAGEMRRLNRRLKE
jgi:hypothetical protein